MADIPRPNERPGTGAESIPPGATRQALDRPTDPGGGPPGSGAGPRHMSGDPGDGNEFFDPVDRHREDVHRQENEGDRLYRDALAELFGEEVAAVELVKWKDIYDLLEQSLDRCEQTVNLLSAISIKNA